VHNSKRICSGFRSALKFILFSGSWLCLFFAGCGGGGAENSGGSTASASESPGPGLVLTAPENGSHVAPVHDVFFFVSNTGWLEYQVNNGLLERVYIANPIAVEDFDNAHRVAISGNSGQAVQIDYRFTDIYGNPDITGRKIFYISEISTQEPVVVSKLVEARSRGLVSGNIIGESYAIAGEFTVRD
jgi:hypothetical protein